jgi:hypothetical protein
MSQARWYPSVTTLNDNRAVAISGSSTSTDWSDIPEVYNPVTNTWTQISGVNTSDMRDIMYPHPYVLPDGTLYVISPSTGVVRKLDVQGKKWITMASAPFVNNATVMYRIGKIMIAGQKFINSDQRIPDSIVPPGSLFNTKVVPSENVRWSGSSWYIYPYNFFKEENRFKNFKILLTTESKNKKINKLFEFIICNNKLNRF